MGRESGSPDPSAAKGGKPPPTGDGVRETKPSPCASQFKLSLSCLSPACAARNWLASASASAGCNSPGLASQRIGCTRIVGYSRRYRRPVLPDAHYGKLSPGRKAGAFVAARSALRIVSGLHATIGTLDGSLAIAQRTAIPIDALRLRFGFHRS
jgi:hypothetical protein